MRCIPHTLLHDALSCPARAVRALLAAGGLSVSLCTGVYAGEVRVNLGVGGALTFLPGTVTVNVGDHVVWVWTSGQHTCTSGDVATGFPDGIWDSGLVPLSGIAPNSGPGMSWKAGAAGTYGYFCNPHWPGMVGSVVVSSDPVSVSDFRLSEIQYNQAAGHDLIEITNIGAAAGDLGRFRISKGATAVSIAADYVPVAPGGTITIHTNESGTNSATDLFMPTIGALVDAAGSVALYAPNAVSPSLADITQAIDYVEWGATGQPNETTAINAGNWTPGILAPSVAVGNSIEFCGTSTEHAGRWLDNSTPNFSGGASNCSTLTSITTTTWGRIKTIYR